MTDRRRWFVHKRLAHPACAALRWLGLRRWAFRLHDATMPDHAAILWDLG